MTEAEWHSSTDIAALVEFAHRRVSTQRLRRFVVACCRRVWDDLYDIEQLAADLVERLLDGTAGEPERAALYEQMRVPAMLAYGRDGAPVALDLLDRDGRFAAEAVLDLLPDGPGRAGEAEAWAVLLRDIVGPLPFRPVTFDPSWRTEAVVVLSRGIYEERAFDRLPVLADALEDAGVSDNDILAHCRGPGPHYKGCWVVDLVLGKQ